MLRVEFLLLIIAFLSTGFSFYEEGEIDYWAPENASTKEVREVSQKEKVNSSSKSSQFDKVENQKEFSWKTTLNPKNDEFYDQGKNTPPKAMIEVMKNPTEENIANYMTLEEKRAKRLELLLAKAQKHNEKKINRILAQVRNQQPVVNNSSFYKAKEIRKKYLIRVYLHAKCSACKKTYPTLLALKKDGFNVLGIHVDENAKEIIQSNSSPYLGINLRAMYKMEDLAVHLAENGGTPLTKILNTETNKEYVIKGVFGLPQINNILN